MAFPGTSSLETLADDVSGRLAPGSTQTPATRPASNSKPAPVGGLAESPTARAGPSPARTPFRLLLILAWVIVFPLAARAQGTPDEARALAERAASHLRQAGPNQAVADFNDPNGAYTDRNLFVVTYNQQRKIVSSLRVPAYLGRDASRFVDEDGKEFGKAIIAMAEQNGAGWVDYRMTNPATMKVELKSSYVIAVDGYVLMVGAYKP
jgi:cytochrome c